MEGFYWENGKNIFTSKAFWGFSVAGLIALSQIFGVVPDESTVANIFKVLTLVLGGFGIRDAK